MKVGYIEFSKEYDYTVLFKMGFVELESNREYLSSRLNVYVKLFSHNLFDDISEGGIIPFYCPEFLHNEDGTTKLLNIGRYEK